MENNEQGKQSDLQKTINDIKLAASNLDKAITDLRSALKSGPISAQMQHIREGIQPLVDMVVKLNKRSTTDMAAEPVTYKIKLNFKAFGLDSNDIDQEEKGKC